MKKSKSIWLLVAMLITAACPALAQTFPGLGCYVGNPGSTAFENAMASFSTAMGQTPKTIDVFTDYTLPILSWPSNANSAASLLSKSASAQTLIPVVSVGLADFPTASPSGTYSESAAVGEMNAVAAGTYDSVFTGVINAYKSHGYSMIYLRIGWEMDGGYEPWYATKDTTTEAAYNAAFQHVANLAHNLIPGFPITGITVKTVWCPADVNWVATSMLASGSAPGVYPGDAYVDVMSIDSYSPCYPEDMTNWTTVPPTQNAYTGTTAAADWAAVAGNRNHFYDYPNATFWTQQSLGGWGMKSAIALAVAHNKPFAISECGAGNKVTSTGPLDDGNFPTYLANSLTSAITQGLHIEFANVWDINVGDGHWKFSDGSKPNELASWQAFVLTMAAATSPLPLGKTDLDIGGPTLPGSGLASAGVYTVKGSGSDIFNTSDQFNFVEQSLTGNQTIIARVTGLSNTNSSAKAGVMCRMTNDANSAFVMESTTPTGYVEMVFRSSAGASAGYTGISTGITPSATTPIWLKLVRSGSGQYNGYYATTVGTPTSTQWIALGSLYLTPSTYQAGLAVTSHTNTALATATFDNVSP